VFQNPAGKRSRKQSDLFGENQCVGRSENMICERLRLQIHAPQQIGKARVRAQWVIPRWLLQDKNVGVGRPSHSVGKSWWLARRSEKFLSESRF
jgi:hypothetical protein